MDKILSARVDEATASRITMLARRLDTSKKKVIEDAIEQYAVQVEEREQLDVLDHTFGSWARREAPEKTVEKARKAFRRSMTRHQK